MTPDTPAGLWTITPASPDWPVMLNQRLGDDTPAALVGRGPRNLLTHHRIALFCSTQTPGDVILRTHDAARRWRDEGRTVISGFHSPIEKDCLRILLRGKQPVILCPARAIETMHHPAAGAEALP